MKCYYCTILFLIVSFLAGCASKYNNLILGNWKRHTSPALDTVLVFGNSGWGDILFRKDHSYRIEGQTVDDSSHVSVPGWNAGTEWNGLWKIKDEILELSIYEREGIPVYLRYEIIKLEKDLLILRSVLGGHGAEDYLVYSRRP